MLPSLLLLGMPSISSLTALTSPSPLKARKDSLPEVVPMPNSVIITPGIRLNSCHGALMFWFSIWSLPSRLTELSTLRAGKPPAALWTRTSPSVTAESSPLSTAWTREPKASNTMQTEDLILNTAAPKNQH